MVPQVIIELTELPRNHNGKVDRKALPEPARPSDDADTRSMTPFEGFVASICEKVLGVTDIGPNEDLLQLGADSLAVEELVTALDTDANRTITSADFLQNPTVAALAALPRHAPSSLRHGVMIELAKGGDASPMFVIAGASGLGIQFRELAELIAADRPVYGLQAHALEWGRMPDISIARISKRYIKAMRSVQPHGPYLVAGFSLGGIIAYDVVRRLRAAGEAVALLALRRRRRHRGHLPVKNAAHHAERAIRGRSNPRNSAPPSDTTTSLATLALPRVLENLPQGSLPRLLATGTNHEYALPHRPDGPRRHPSHQCGGNRSRQPAHRLDPPHHTPTGPGNRRRRPPHHAASTIRHRACGRVAAGDGGPVTHPTRGTPRIR